MLVTLDCSNLTQPSRSKHSPAWKYLVGTDGKIMTAGAEPLRLVPKFGAKSGEVCAPRAREVPHGTLIKMSDYKAPAPIFAASCSKSLNHVLHRYYDHPDPYAPLAEIKATDQYMKAADQFKN